MTSSSPRALGAAGLRELDEFCRRRRRVFYPKTDFDEGERKLSPRLSSEAARAVSAEAVARACEQSLGARPAKVAAIEGAGTFHSLFRVTLEDGESLVFKARARGAAGRTFEFLIDRWAAETLLARGVPVAPVRAVDVSWDGPFDFEILESAAGRPLREFEDEETQHVEPRLLAELGRVAALVHGVETEGFGLLDVRSILSADDNGGRPAGLHASWKDYVLLNLGAHVRACSEAGAVTDGECELIEGCFGRAAALLDSAPSRLLHGDLGHHNVFTDGRTLTAIIDWEDCLCGDPAFDVAYWGTFCRDEMRRAFLEGYAGRSPLPQDFERRYWLYYLRVALSKTVHRLRFGYADRTGRPPASLRIQKALARLVELEA